MDETFGDERQAMAKRDLGVLLSMSEYEGDRREAKKWLAEAVKEGITAPAK